VFNARFGIIPYIKQISFSVLSGFQNIQRILLYISLTDWFFITVEDSVYFAVRTDFLI
jgi:hypothetical protein